MSILIPKHWLDLSFSESGLTSADIIYTDTTTVKSAIDDLYNKKSHYILTIIKSGYGSGTVTSNPSGINCGSTCSYQFAAGTTVTLTATPDPSFVFSGWYGGVIDTNPTVTITMNYDTIVEAAFDTLYNLVIIKSGTGTGTVTSLPSGINCGSICSYQFASGTNVTLTATPNSPSVFSGWSGSAIGINPTITITMNSNKNVIATFNILYTLTLAKTGTGTGTVTSSPFGINCGATCSYQFVSGTNVTLTATSDLSSAFIGWSGDATGTNSIVTITMNSNKNVTATFTPIYALTVTKSGTGTGTITSSPSGINCGPTCSYQFASGTSVTLTATPDAISAFIGWSGDATGTNSTVTVTMSSNKNVTATFTPKYTLTVTKSGTGTGTVTSSPSGINCGATCSYQFVSGTSVTLTATPDSSSVFGGWSGDATGTNSTVTITMNSNKNVTATFNALYTLTLTKSGTGTGTVISSPSGINCGSTCSYQFVSGTNVTLTATSDSGSVFGGWYGDATGTNTATIVTMNSNKNVTATFNALYTLTVTKSGDGSGTVSSSPSGINCGATCSYQFVSGTNVILTATPDTLSVFSGWSDDATGTNSTVTVTMNSNKSVIATFNINAAGFFAGGANNSLQSFIDKLLFSNDSRSTLTTTLSQTIVFQSACNSSLAGYFAGGYNFIDKLLFSNELRSTLTATLSQSVGNQSACNSTLAGYFAGGWNSMFQSFIDKLLFSNELRSTLTATLSQTVRTQSACNSTLAGYFAGGNNDNDNYNEQSFIDKLLFSNELRSTLTSTLSQSIYYQAACNSTSVGYFAGGIYGVGYYSFINKLLFSDDSRTTLIATLSQTIFRQSACNSTLAGYFAGGYHYDGNINDVNDQSFIDKLLFSNELRSTLTATLSQPICDQSACQSGGIL
jgi:uncharacterized repeat protein (TIGR02543 family)